MKRNIICLLSVLLLATVSKAQKPQKESGDTCLYLAVKNDYALLNRLLSRCNCLNMTSIDYLPVIPSSQVVNANNSSQRLCVVKLSIIKNEECIDKFLKLIKTFGESKSLNIKLLHLQ